MRTTHQIGGAVIGATLWAASPASPQSPAVAQPTASAAIQPNDYAKDASWLCRPRRHEACDIDLTTTVVAADGTFARETWTTEARGQIGGSI